MAPTRLEDLPDEILEVAFGFLQAQPDPDWRHQNTRLPNLLQYCQPRADESERRDGLRALCSVNKRLQAICQPLLYRYLMPPRRSQRFHSHVSAWIAANGKGDGETVSSAGPSPKYVRGVGIAHTTWLALSCYSLKRRAIRQSMFAAFTGLRGISLDVDHCDVTRILDSAVVGMHQLEEVSFSTMILHRKAMHSIYTVVSMHLPNLKHLTMAMHSIQGGTCSSMIPFTLQKLQSLRFCDNLLRTTDFRDFLECLQAPCLDSVTVAQWGNSRTDLRHFPWHLSRGVERLYLIHDSYSRPSIYPPIRPTFPVLKSLTLESGEKAGGPLGLHVDSCLPDTIAALCIKGPEYDVLSSIAKEIGGGGLCGLKKLVIDIGTNRNAGAAGNRIRRSTPAIIDLQKMLRGTGVCVILQGFHINWKTDGRTAGQVREPNYRQML